MFLLLATGCSRSVEKSEYLNIPAVADSVEAVSNGETAAQVVPTVAGSPSCKNEARMAEIDIARKKGYEDVGNDLPPMPDPNLPPEERIPLIGTRRAAMEAKNARWKKQEVELVREYDRLIEDCVKNNCLGKEHHLASQKTDKEFHAKMGEFEESIRRIVEEPMPQHLPSM